MKKTLNLLITIIFSISQIWIPTAFAEVFLPAPGQLVSLSTSYSPANLQGMEIHADNPFHFDFLVNLADSDFDSTTVEEEAYRLIRYFYAAMTTSEDALWVNLSPYEEDRIIEEEFAKTEMGRDMLGQDYLLKQITASLMHPEKEVGKVFWNRIYSRIQQEYGEADIPMNTLNKVWIIPNEADVYVEDNRVLLVNTSMKILLEEDYFAQKKDSEINFQESTEQYSDVKKIIKDVIIPELEFEVNHGSHFATLRQMYHALVLSTWFKRNLKNHLLTKSYANQGKVSGIDKADPEFKDLLYQRYIQTFKEGVFDIIQEEYDPIAQTIVPRRYFSGGLFGKGQMPSVQEVDFDEALLAVNLNQKWLWIKSSATIKDLIDTDSASLSNFTQPFYRDIFNPEYVERVNEAVQNKNIFEITPYQTEIIEQAGKDLLSLIKGIRFQNQRDKQNLIDEISLYFQDMSQKNSPVLIFDEEVSKFSTAETDFYLSGFVGRGNRRVYLVDGLATETVTQNNNVKENNVALMQLLLMAAFELMLLDIESSKEFTQETYEREYIDRLNLIKSIFEKMDPGFDRLKKSLKGNVINFDPRFVERQISRLMTSVNEKNINNLMKDDIQTVFYPNTLNAKKVFETIAKEAHSYFFYKDGEVELTTKENFEEWILDNFANYNKTLKFNQEGIQELIRSESEKKPKFRVLLTQAGEVILDLNEQFLDLDQNMFESQPLYLMFQMALFQYRLLPDNYFIFETDEVFRERDQVFLKDNFYLHYDIENKKFLNQNEIEAFLDEFKGTIYATKNNGLVYYDKSGDFRHNFPNLEQKSEKKQEKKKTPKIKLSFFKGLIEKWQKGENQRIDWILKYGSFRVLENSEDAQTTLEASPEKEEKFLSDVLIYKVNESGQAVEVSSEFKHLNDFSKTQSILFHPDIEGKKVFVIYQNKEKDLSESDLITIKHEAKIISKKIEEILRDLNLALQPGYALDKIIPWEDLLGEIDSNQKIDIKKFKSAAQSLIDFTKIITSVSQQYAQTNLSKFYTLLINYSKDSERVFSKLNLLEARDKFYRQKDIEKLTYSSIDEIIDVILILRNLSYFLKSVETVNDVSEIQFKQKDSNYVFDFDQLLNGYNQKLSEDSGYSEMLGSQVVEVFEELNYFKLKSEPKGNPGIDFHQKRRLIMSKRVYDEYISKEKNNEKYEIKKLIEGGLLKVISESEKNRYNDENLIVIDLKTGKQIENFDEIPADYKGGAYWREFNVLYVGKYDFDSFDSAQLENSEEQNPASYGGIDFNAESLQLNQSGFIDEAMFSNMEEKLMDPGFLGVQPLILDIKPVQFNQLFSGQPKPEKEV